MATLGKNQVFEIKNGDGTSFHNLVLRKSAVESIVMSLGDKISGDVYYKDNTLSVTMHEYITYNGVNYMLINPPTIVREGVVSDNSELRGMTKYSFVFYHPMCQLSNFPFTDVAVTNDETRYLSESKTFSWIGKPADFVAKMNKNLDGTEWIVEISSRFPQDKLNELSDVIPFDNATIADACKTFYDTWGVPYVVDKVASTEASYAAGKRFKLVMGLPSNEIYENAAAEQQQTPFVFQMGHGVGLKNNSRTPRNNKIITRISGYGSENNIPYGYPQVRWYGTAGQSFTYGDHAGVYTNVTIGGVHFDKVVSYPIYKGILNGEYVELIKHPFTRTHLMPSVYRTTLFNKISLYNDLGEVNTDYDPDITLVDYYDAIYSAQYPYPNTINLQAPSYESHEFEDEKPELGEAHIISATPLNNDLTPASSWDDSLDDEGNYKQSYFQMVLPQLSFDLYACASITEEMQINMRSGACLGCTFTVQVDWDDYKQNFYDEEGNFAPNGSQRDLTKYPKSNQGSISLVLQKDNSTFGTLMPNMYQYPKGETSSGAGDGDTFVILGISLPESYILAAEDRLDVDMKSYMLENNEHYFDYPLKFDEDFLFHNENILSQIRPNTVVRFNYAGQTQALFVKQITIKYGEQQLPQYDITLTDNVEVVLNQIGQVAEDVEKLSTLIAILRQSYGKNVWNELAKKLSKTQDDTAAGYITMLKGLQVGASFVPDILGEGGVLRMRDDGKVELVTDILYARMRAYFDSVVIREYRHESGNRIKSPAQGFNASRVEYIKVVDNVETIVDDASEADFFRCYWRVDDGEKKAENQFIIGDLAFCEHADVVNGSLVTKRYWRVVVGRNAGNTTTEDGEAWIDLSNAHDANGNPVMTTISWEGQGGTTQTLSVKSFESSANSYPEAHDDICMLGCTTDTTRQGAIIEYVSGVDAPTYQIYQGLGADATNPYSLSGKNQIGFGYNTSTGRAYMNVYGDTYIGDRNRNTFLEYKQSGTGGVPELNIKAKVQILPNGSTINGQSIPEYIKDNQNNYDDTEVQQAISDLNDAVGNLQDQIDGSIETLYGDVDPSVPSNDPYKDYTTDEKEKHLGDMYYNSTTGYAYRYDKSVEEVGGEEVTTYFWQIIRDTGITQAIADAAAALGLAETKAKIFTTTAGTLPTPPYKINDVWVNATYPANGSTYSNEILKCVTARAQGATANIADWAKASKYTDDSSLQNFISATYDPTIAGLTEQVDRKIESWFQSADPSADWYDDTQTPVLDVRADHVGDMWYSESTHLLKRYDSETTGEGEQAVTTYFWTTIQDQKAIDAYDNAAHAQDTADGKRRVFTAQPVAADAYDVGDLWVNATYPATGTKTYENDVLRCKTAKAAGVAFNISHWQKASKYTDDTALTNFINGDYANTIGALEGQLDKKAETWYQSANPADDWYVVDPETQEVTTDTRADHVGDLWYKTSDDTTWYYKRSGAGTEQDPYTYEWKQQNVPLAVFDKIDGKADIFVSKPSTYNKYDMWIIESNTTTCPNADIPEGCKRGDIVIAKNKRTNSYTRGDWEKKDRYTDDSAFNGYITAFLNGSGASGDSATAAAIQKAIAGALGSGTVVDGGLLLSSLIGMRKYKGSGSVTELSSYDTWGGISGEYNDDDETVEGGAKGHGIAAWYGGDMVDKEMLSDEEIANGWGTGEGQYRWAKGVDRFDGSGYRADGNITWDEQGRVSIKDVTTIISSNNTDVLNELITFNNAFHFNLSQGTSTVLSIEPQAAFTNLYIRNTTNPNAPYHVATENWVDDHYVSKTFFRQLFRAFKPNETAGQADVEVQPNTIDATISNIKAMVGFWTEQYVSALGHGADGGGGSTTLAQLNDVNIGTLADGQFLVYDQATTHWINKAVTLVTSLANLTDVNIGSQTNGQVLGWDSTTSKWIAKTIESYTLPAATSGALGGIKIGYDGTTAKTYAVQLDSNNKAYVAVPWTDTIYDVATQSANGLMSSTDKTKLDGIAENANNYSLPLAASGKRGGIKIGYTESGTNYAVKLSSEKAYVTVPWTNTWRGVYLGGTSKVDTGTSTKALNFVAGSNVTIDYAAAGTEEGQSGSDSYFNIKISSSYVDTWRNILLAGTEKLGTATNTKGLNFVADGKTTITFLAAGTDEGQSGSADYATIKISSTWRGIQDNLTSDSTTDSLSAKQGKNLKASITTLEGYFENGVAKKAKQLNTARTLWGQNFNGTANVSGNMTGVGNITMGSTDGTYIKIGDIYIGYDSTNSAIEIYKLGENNAHVAANLYAHGAISALGQGVDGGGGGTGDVTWALLASDQDTRQIAISHLNGVNGVLDILTGYVTSGKNYAVVKDASNHLYVNVPWTDNDTKNTAGSTNKAATKLFLVGAESQVANPQTYSNVNVYIGTDNCLYSNGTKVLTSHQSLSDYVRAYSRSEIGTSPNFDNPTQELSFFEMRVSSETSGETGTKPFNGFAPFLSLKKENVMMQIAGGNAYGWFIRGKQSANVTLTDVAWQKIITSENIGSQSVNYATSAGSATNDSDGNTINSTYLKLSGGSLSGNLTIATTGESKLTLGNTTSGVIGAIYLYANGSRYTKLTSAATGASREVVFPNNSGTVALTSDFATASVNYATSAGKLSYYSAISSSTNLDAFHETDILKVTTWNSFDILDISNGVIIDGGYTNDSYGFQLAIDDDPTYKIGLRQRNADGWSDWKLIPMGDGTGASGTWGISVTGNAASATKLQTARTLWGQSFDGSANVDGTMILNCADWENDYGIHINEGSHASYGFDILYGKSDLFKIARRNGSTTAINVITIGRGGNVSILDSTSITGSLSATGSITTAGNIATSSNDGAYVQIGGARIVWDNTNKALKVIQSDNSTAANFYATGAISALGQGVDGGGGGQGDVTWALLASQATGGRTIHSSYISGTLANYLPLSGGTISNPNFSEQLTINRSGTGATGDAAINFTNTSDGLLGRLVVTGSGDPLGKGKLAFYDGSTNTVLHSGNSSVSKSGETLTVKINGTSYSLTNTNTTYSAGKGLRLSGTQFISDVPRVAKDSKVFGGQYTWIMEEYTSGSNYNLPSNAWYHIMSTQGADTNYGTQLALGMNTEGAYYRRYDNGTWKEWKSLINTNTTYSAGSGLLLNGTTFSIASNVLVQGSVIDTHHEGSGTITLDGTNELYAFYDRGGTCDAYEVEQSATLTNQTLTRTSTSVGALSANVFNGIVGYNQNPVYSGEKFAVYDLVLPANYVYGATFFWSFGNSLWKPAKMRVLVGKYSASGFTYISRYSSDDCPTYGKVGFENGSTGFDRLRIVVSKYTRLACFGITNYATTGLNTTYMSRSISNNVYRDITPAIDNKYVLGTSSLCWKEVRAVNLYGTFEGDGKGHKLGYRHLDAGNGSTWNDHRLYLGYGAYTDGSTQTNSIGMYYSKFENNTWTRTEIAEITSGGLNVKNGTLKQGGNAVIHSGNIGSQSVNYATSAGNASTATTLQTSRTLWGQSFDGSGNVSGNMTGVGTISASGNNTITKSNTNETCFAAKNNNGQIELLTSTNRGVYDRTNSTWLIATNGTNTFLLRGSVGIGTTSPEYALDVSGSIKASGSFYVAANQRIEQVGGSGDFYIGNSNNNGWVRIQDMCSMNYTDNNVCWTIRTSGNAVFANVTSNGAVSALSDARHKQVVRDTNLSVEQIANMPSVIFKWTDEKHDNDLHVGTLAQPWQQVLPEVVLESQDKEHTLSLSYGVAALVAAITTARKVVDHEARIKALEKENKELREEISRLKIA